MIPLKLTFVLPSMKSGGGNRVFVELGNVLAEDFENVTMLYANNSSDTSHYDISKKVCLKKVGKEAKSIYYKIGNVFRLCKQINKILSDAESIVIISDPLLCIFFSFLGNTKHERLIRFIQADDYKIYDDLYLLKNKLVLGLYKWLCRYSYNKFNNYIYNSIYTYQQFGLVVNKQRPLHIVHPGININIFNVNKDKAIDKLNICIVARKHPWKGFIDFIEAWNVLDVELKNEINAVAVISHDNLSSFNLPEKFNLLKPNSDSDISRIMNESHIFISTSWWEGFGLPPLEAMACGCAVLASDSKGILEYGQDYQNCLIYEPKNISELCTKLKLLITDVKLRNEIASEAVVDAKKFTWYNAGIQFKEYIKLKYNAE